MTDHVFGDRSVRKLEGVNSDLVKVAELALNKSTVDFGITEGLRSAERQKILRDTGKSQTLNSPHLTGHAVDVVAFYDDKYTYEPFRLFTNIAEAFRLASIETGIPIVWGAAWLKTLGSYPSAQAALDDYTSTRRSQGRKVFLDGVHFELHRARYGW